MGHMSGGRRKKHIIFLESSSRFVAALYKAVTKITSVIIFSLKRNKTLTPTTLNLLLFQYKVLLYSLDGRLLSTYQAYQWSLGIKSVAWSPSSQFLAIGSYDEKVRNWFIISFI